MLAKEEAILVAGSDFLRILQTSFIIVNNRVERAIRRLILDLQAF